MAKRVSGGFDKKIFGVPVFPVMRQDSSNINGNHNNEINDNNSHAYNQQYRNSNFGEKKSPESQNNNNYKPQNIFLNNHNSNNNIITTNTSNNNTNQWKLRHIDFLPSSIKSKKDEEFEKFRSAGIISFSFIVLFFVLIILPINYFVPNISFLTYFSLSFLFQNPFYFIYLKYKNFSQLLSINYHYYYHLSLLYLSVF